MSKKITVILSIFAIGIIVVCIVRFNTSAYATYQYIFKTAHFEKGEKMFFLHKTTDTATKNFNLWRMVTPLTINDIDSLTISPDEKTALKLKLNPLLKPYLMQTNDYVVAKSPDYFMGNYLGHQYADVKFTDGVFPSVNVNAIYPNQKSFIIDETSLLVSPVPEGYKWADHVYYFFSYNLVKNSQ